MSSKRTNRHTPSIKPQRATRNIIWLTLSFSLGFGSVALADFTLPATKPDPLEAVGHRNYFNYYSSRHGDITSDRWIVFVCSVWDTENQPRLADPTWGWVSPEEYAQMFAEHAIPFFEWVSRGRYRPEFVPGQAIDVRIGTGDGTEHAAKMCEQEAEQAFYDTNDAPDVHGAMIVLQTTCGDDICGKGSAGAISASMCVSSNVTDCEQQYSVILGEPAPDLDWRIRPSGDGRFPWNERSVWVAGHNDLLVSTVIHELGHALGWPHSFSGETQNEYDNGMDFMSGALTVEEVWGQAPHVATHVYNLYTAGWLHPHSEVAVNTSTSGSLSHQLCDAYTGDHNCLKMLVLSSGEDGRFEVLGARIRDGYDSGILQEGVERYWIEQTPYSCHDEVDSFGTKLCNTTTRIRQAVHEPETLTVRKTLNENRYIDYTEHVSTAHTYTPGESFESNGRTVTIGERQGDSFLVTVVGAEPHEGRFVDDDTNPHESAIEELADWGITQGCAPTLYCPDGSVTRAQMAAFLIRAVGAEDDDEGMAAFNDVPADAWFAKYVSQLWELEITRGYGDGTFRPDVVVSRAQMATFLARAFDVDLSEALSGRFADVADNNVHASAIETLSAQGIIEGCDVEGRQFCPDTALRRDEMASWMTALMRS